MAITNLLTAYSDLDDLMTPVSNVEATTGSQIYTTSVKHGLKVGDYVNIVNIANDSGSFNGRYQVGEVNANEVEFTITGLTRLAVAAAATTGVAASVGDLEPGLIVEESLSEVVSVGTPDSGNDTLALGSGQVAAIDVGVGDFVTIAGADDTNVANGTFSVTAVSTDTLSFASSASPALTTTADGFTIFKSDASGNALIRGSYRTSEITVIAVQPDGTKTKTIKFNITENGALENAGTGITGQALYSYFKFLWKNVQSITQFDFPMLSITNEQFEFINSWYLDDASTINQKLVLASSSFAVNFTSSTEFTSSVSDVDLRKLQAGDNITIQGGSNNGTTAAVGSVGYSRSTGVYTVSVSAGTFSNTGSDTITSIDTVVNVTPSNLIRTAGWTVQNNSGEYQKLYYSGVITLGTLVDETDTPYYVQRDALTAGTNDTKYSGPANEGVRIRSVADARSSAANVAITYTAASSASTIAENTTTKIDWTAFEEGDFIEITDASVTSSGITGVLHEITAVDSITGITVNSTFGGNDSTTGSALIEADFAGTFKIFVRELGKTFADADLDDIGVSEMTYIVYRFPVTNSSDADVPTSIDDTTIDSGGLTASLTALTADPYDDIQISYLEASPGVPYDIKGTIDSGTAVPVAVGEVYKDGKGQWFKVTTAGTVNTTVGAGDYDTDYTKVDAVLDAYEGERIVSGTRYAFTVIVDANDQITTANPGPYVDANDNTSASNVYLFIQWALRRVGNGNNIEQGEINEGAAAGAERVGNIADRLVTFVGPTLTTQPGVFIDDIASTDQNNVSFTEATVGGVNVGSGTTYTGASGLKYPLTVTVRIDFNDNLQADGDAVFYMYYSDGTGTGYGAQDFSATQATQVVKADGSSVGSDVSNAISAAQSYQFQYGYEEDATAGRTPGTDVSVTTVAIGLSSGQYVKSTATITNTGATISLVAPLERNYSNA